MKLNNINLIRILLILPCLIFKIPLNHLLGINNNLHTINLIQRLIFEVVTLFGMIYVVGFLEYNFIKFVFPGLFQKIKQTIDGKISNML